MVFLRCAEKEVNYGVYLYTYYAVYKTYNSRCGVCICAL